MDERMRIKAPAREVCGLRLHKASAHSDQLELDRLCKP